MARILVFEAQAGAPVVRDICQRLGHDVRAHPLQDSAAAQDGWAELIVFDPGVRHPSVGVELCHALRRHPATARTPLVAVIGPGQGTAEAHLRAAGVHAFVQAQSVRTGTFAGELEQILRQCGITARTDRCVSVGELVLDLEQGEVHMGPLRVHLTRAETDVLHQLIVHRGRTVTREQLLRRDGQRLPKGSRTVDMHVKQLRRKLASFGAAIQTKYGVGYRLDSSAFNTAPASV